VALYAIASIGVLILIRSALGRLLTILGLAAGHGRPGLDGDRRDDHRAKHRQSRGRAPDHRRLLVFAGGLWWAFSMRSTPDKIFVGAASTDGRGPVRRALTMSPGAIQNGAPNYTYFLIMLVATAIAAAANAYHPIAWTREEFWFAIGAPMVVGLWRLGGRASPQRAGCSKVGAAGLVAGARSSRRLLVRRHARLWAAGISSGPERSGLLRRSARRRPDGLAAARIGLRPPGRLDGGLRCCPADRRLRGLLRSLGDALAAPDRRDTASLHRRPARSVLPGRGPNGYCVNGDGWPNGTPARI
jgi:hypothetical protein